MHNVCVNQTVKHFSCQQSLEKIKRYINERSVWSARRSTQSGENMPGRDVYSKELISQILHLWARPGFRAGPAHFPTHLYISAPVASAAHKAAVSLLDPGVLPSEQNLRWVGSFFILSIWSFWIGLSSFKSLNHFVILGFWQNKTSYILWLKRFLLLLSSCSSHFLLAHDNCVSARGWGGRKTRVHLSPNKVSPCLAGIHLKYFLRSFFPSSVLHVNKDTLFAAGFSL